ncbi:DNA internalization-related competence protein ComEC/Rec2 [Desulfofalx alkaliphila]|uniref:DNA internalization-related competence protein ComEC/Rec2 n=1 Tax=Desulfofalx alkaliphila TaxID=105483 RepID=UPI0004E27133|nr:DNA internalization-related competence protein ComEC/Rec2 [Desulfofalx alkaliphila]
MNRPLFKFCTIFILGLWLGTFLSLPLGVLFTVCAVLLICAGLVYWLADHYLPWLLVLLCLSTGLLMVGIYDETHRSSLVHYAGQRVTVTGVITDYPDQRPDKVFYLVDVRELQVQGETARAHGLMRVAVYNPSQIYTYGDLIALTGLIQVVEPPGNPGTFDYRAYLERRGIHVVMSVWDEQQVNKLGTAAYDGLKGLSLSARERLQGVIDDTLAPEHSALVQGMLFGSRGMIPDEINADFQRVSLVHILCVSGLHVGLVLAGFLILYHLLRLPAGWATPLASLVLVFYAVMTGLGPPVIRATVMGLLVLWARQLGRHRDWPTTMVLAAAIILARWPYALWEPGFQLSFAVAWGILYLTPWVEQRLKDWPRPVRLAVAVPLTAELTAVPLMAYYFSIVSLVGVVTNILVAPLVAAVMLLSGLSMLLGLILFPLANILGASTGALLDLMLWVVKTMASLPMAAVYLPSPPWWAVVAAYGLLAYLPKASLKGQSWERHRRLMGIVAVIIALLLLLVPNGTQNKLTVHFIDVGQGDAALIQTPGGKNILIDTGGLPGEFESGSGAGNKVVLPYLQSLGVNGLDLLILSHPHEDHAGGALGLTRRMPVKLVLVAPLESINDYPAGWERPDTGYLQLLARLQQRGMPIREGIAGHSLQVDKDVDIVILSPHQPLPDLNDSSLVVKIDYRERSFLFTGDIGENKQRQLARDVKDLQADVLKVPHHGSRFFNPDFFAAVAPHMAVISAAKNNRFGHPAPELLEHLEGQGVKIYRTDRHGAVIVSTDGSSVWVDTGKSYQD